MAITSVTPDVVSPQRATMELLNSPENTESVPARPSRVVASAAGVSAILVGAWGGLAPYIGSAIHYNADGSATWTWNLQHGLLSLLPGTIAVVAGVVLLANTWLGRPREGVVERAGAVAAPVLLALSSVWFLIGTTVWPIYYSSGVLAPASAVRTFSESLGYYLGEGFVLAVLAGLSASWAARALARRPSRFVSSR